MEALFFFFQGVGVSDGRSDSRRPPPGDMRHCDRDATAGLLHNSCHFPVGQAHRLCWWHQLHYPGFADAVPGTGEVPVPVPVALLALIQH